MHIGCENESKTEGIEPIPVFLTPVAIKLESDEQNLSKILPTDDAKETTETSLSTRHDLKEVKATSDLPRDESKEANPSDEAKQRNAAVPPIMHSHSYHQPWPVYNGMYHPHHPYHHYSNVPYQMHDYHSKMHPYPHPPFNLYPKPTFQSSAPYGHFGKPLYLPHQQYIKTVSDNDIICGRGGAVNNHPGNKRFRQFIQKYKHQYLNESKQRKPMVAMRVLRMVKESTPPGR